MILVSYWKSKYDFYNTLFWFFDFVKISNVVWFQLFLSMLTGLTISSLHIICNTHVSDAFHFIQMTCIGSVPLCSTSVVEFLPYLKNIPTILLVSFSINIWSIRAKIIFVTFQFSKLTIWIEFVMVFWFVIWIWSTSCIQWNDDKD